MVGAFQACLTFTLRHEGGYVDHPRDPGGCTNMGITLATLRAWRGMRVDCAAVRSLKRAEAADIYLSRYWLPIAGNKLPVGVDLAVFDWGVNAGPRRSARALQKLVGVKVDGWIGPKTVAAIGGVTKNAEERECLVVALTEERQKFYERLRTFSTFGRGWTRRNRACKTRALRMIRGETDGRNDVSPLG